MNLQVITPICGQCVMNCPYCMANAHEHGNKFQDLYRENKDAYFGKMRRVFRGMDLNTIVVTGTADPLQEPEVVKEISQMLKECMKPSSTIELQTRIHNRVTDEISQQFDAIAFSIDNPKQIPSIKKPQSKVNRFVFILTDAFNGYNLQQLLDMGQFTPEQITFKILVSSNEINCKQDEWVRQHNCDLATQERLKSDAEKENKKGKISVRWDDTCWIADNRYIVFRQDGDLYHTWDDPEPAMIVRPMEAQIKARASTITNKSGASIKPSAINPKRSCCDAGNAVPYLGDNEASI